VLLPRMDQRRVGLGHRLTGRSAVGPLAGRFSTVAAVAVDPGRCHIQTMTPTASVGRGVDSRLLAALSLTAGSLIGLVIQLSNDRTPGTGNISPASITCIAMFVAQLIWLIAFARHKEPRDEKYRVASHIIGAVAIAAMAVYLFVQALNGAVVEVLGFGLVFIFLMATLSIRHRSKKA
jgi:hypothetical protein